MDGTRPRLVDAELAFLHTCACSQRWKHTCTQAYASEESQETLGGKQPFLASGWRHVSVRVYTVLVHTSSVSYCHPSQQDQEAWNTFSSLKYTSTQLQAPGRYGPCVTPLKL